MPTFASLYAANACTTVSRTVHAHQIVQILGICLISVPGETCLTIEKMLAFTAVGGVPFTNCSSNISHTNKDQDGDPFLPFSCILPVKGISINVDRCFFWSLYNPCSSEYAVSRIAFSFNALLSSFLQQSKDISMSFDLIAKVHNSCYAVWVCLCVSTSKK